MNVKVRSKRRFQQAEVISGDFISSVSSYMKQVAMTQYFFFLNPCGPCLVCFVGIKLHLQFKHAVCSKVEGGCSEGKCYALSNLFVFICSAC